jgi:hypothetical protein
MRGDPCLDMAIDPPPLPQNGRMAKKRGYTYDYTPKSEKHGRYLLDKIPADLWRRAKQKAKREGVSIRATLLRMLTEWVAADR